MIPKLVYGEGLFRVLVAEIKYFFCTTQIKSAELSDLRRFNENVAKTLADTGVSKCYLGRPWRPYAKTVFINTEMGAHILSAGWNNWNNPANEATVLYAEFKSKGPGANARGRVPWAKQLTETEGEQYTVQKIFNDWNPEK